MLRRILKFKKQEVTGGWRPLHNGSVHNPYSSSDILRVIKSRRYNTRDFISYGEIKAEYKIL
jgi:hypothetical protein